jgi:hypothetical protein
MLDTSRIRAITFDLDDTLWPIWPTIERAEKALTRLAVGACAPMTSALFANPHALHDIRQQVMANRPDILHDLSAIRREAISLALYPCRRTTPPWPSLRLRCFLPNATA